LPSARWIFLLLSLPLVFTGRPAFSAEAEKVALYASRIENQAITMDGHLAESIWHAQKPATDFIQKRPHIGQPAQGTSLVWVLYDDHSLYIGADLIDPDPSLISADERHRDASLDTSDTLAILLDTYHDHQTGFLFEVNPLSAKKDGLISQGGRQVNQDWDGLWEAAAQRTDDGWSVEIQIPFKTLRFKPGEKQTWGIQFQRRIPHLDEVATFAPLSIEQDFMEVSHFGHLKNVTVPSPPQRLTIKPYVRASTFLDRADQKNDFQDADAGVDLRYMIRTHLALDVTFNTDFAETEVDRFVSNLTRFPLFFPEKREFFLEGKGHYDFGLTSRVQPFFSRKIGLVKRRPVPISGGGKLTGKVGPWGIGLLGMSTRNPSENFGVIRLSRDIGVGSNVGLIATDRQGESPVGKSFGLDTTLARGERLTLHGFWTTSKEVNQATEGQYHEASYTQIDFRDPGLRLYLHHLRIDESFSLPLGFVPQADLLETQGYADFRRQPVSGPVREYALKAEMTYQTEADNDFLYRSHYFRGLTYLRTGEFLLFSIDPQKERLPSDFEIRPGIVIPANIYRYREYNLLLFSDQSAPTSGTLSLKTGEFYGGKKTSVNLGIATTPREGLKWGAGMDLSFVHLPAGDFISEIIETDVAWAQTPTTFFQGLVQWDREDDTLGANLRFRWEYRPGSRFYFIVNPTHQKDKETYLLLAKLTWLWD
jgi:hypothetical protein